MLRDNTLLYCYIIGLRVIGVVTYTLRTAGFEQSGVYWPLFEVARLEP